MESDVIVFLSCGSEHPDCIFDIALDLSSRSFILSCEIVVGSWVGISQVKIKSRLSRSALLLFVLRMIAETRSIRNPANGTTKPLV